MAYIAPAGTPLGLADLAAGLGAGLVRRRAHDDLRDILLAHSGQAHCWPVASGRAAMTLIFTAMKNAAADPRRCEVIVPGYTCYSVPAAVERAGLKPRLCDIDPHTLSMDPDELRRRDFSTVLAIVTANLYGVPNNLADIERIAADQGVYMLDDAAQSLGARVGGRAAGGFGDAGLYSFDKGKNITTLQGGAIIARSGALARTIQAEYDKLQTAAPTETLTYTIKLALYGLLLRPRLYGIVQRMPGLGLGRTQYETRYPLTRYSPLLAGLALHLARRLDAINAVRIGNALRLRAALEGAPGVRLQAQQPNASPVFARLPFFVNDAERRSELISRLNAAGIGATASYPQALIDVPELSRLLHPADVGRNEAARLIARTIVTLPTHAYCPPDLAGRVREIIDRTLG